MNTQKTLITKTQKAILDTLSEDRENYSDGWHTFAELYEFRKAYNAALFNEWSKVETFEGFRKGEASSIPKYNVHKSWKHHDGEYCFGEKKKWFIVSAMLPTGLISNHYEAKDWNLFQVPSVEIAIFKYDGHTASDVLDRIKRFLTM